MIIVEETNGTNLTKKRKLFFYLIDAHHHIGEDEDGHRNLSVRGSFDFFRSIWRLLNQKYKDMGSFPEHFRPKFKIINTRPPPPLEFLSSMQIHNQSWIFDQFVAFPFHDIFRNISKENEIKAQYNNSNKRIGNLMSDLNTGSRLIGYCRIDPQDGDLALRELDNAIKNLGLKGLKLHPLSDGWNNKNFFLNEDSIIFKIFQKSIDYNIPVIFDCRFTTTLSWIYECVKILRQKYSDNNFSEHFINSRLK
ncbi:MAG: hypothetical protein ACTSQS_15400, partial [Promethearchaeota archaeon]